MSSLRRSTRITASQQATAAAASETHSASIYTKASPGNSTKKRKSRAQTTNTTTSNAMLSTPPEPKRRKPAKKQDQRQGESPITATPPPFTPTPSGVGLIASVPAGAAESGHPLEDLASLQRPAEPHATNAPLSTPGDSQLVAHTSPHSTVTSPNKANATASVSPSKVSPSKKKLVLPPDMGTASHATTSTTETLLLDACAHLCQVDPRLKGLVEKHHCKMFSPKGLAEVVDPFTALASGIIGQQVSGQAAASIRKKFTALFDETHPSFPSPAQVLRKDLPALRTAGLSQRKAEYIQGLAEKFASGELSAQMLISASDEDLIEKLVAVRGLGRWSVEMFACFGLKRMDVFSTGDLGVQRGMATYVGRDVNKLKSKGGKFKFMSEQEMLDIASKFSPYRSLFMWYMWRIGDVDISVLQK